MFLSAGFRGVGYNNSSSVLLRSIKIKDKDQEGHLGSLDYIGSGHKPSYKRKHVSSEASFSCVRLLTECEFRHQTFIRPIPPQIDHEIVPFFIFFMAC